MVIKARHVLVLILVAAGLFGCSRQAFVLVPSFIQKDVDNARTWAKENQITLEINQQPAPPSLGVKPGKIMNQAPNPGSEIQPGDSVIVYVASKVPYDPQVAKANLETDLNQWPTSDENYDKFTKLMAKGTSKSSLNFEYKSLSKVPNTDYKKLQRDLNKIEVPREVEGNVAYLSLVSSLNKIVSLQNAANASQEDILKAVNAFEEQRHLLNQLIQ